MTPSQAGALMRRARKLLRVGKLTHHQFTLLDCIVWSCRSPGSDRLSVSYTRLQKLAHMARSTIASGIARLEQLCLLRRVRRRVRVAWSLGVASRQATNLYVLITESDERPVYRVQKILTSTVVAVHRKQDALEKALSRLGEAIAAG